MDLNALFADENQAGMSLTVAALKMWRLMTPFAHSFRRVEAFDYPTPDEAFSHWLAISIQLFRSDADAARIYEERTAAIYNGR